MNSLISCVQALQLYCIMSGEHFWQCKGLYICLVGGLKLAVFVLGEMEKEEIRHEVMCAERLRACVQA